MTTTTNSEPTTQPSDLPPPGTGNPVFDTTHITYVFNQRGYRINEFASLLDISSSVVEAFLAGHVEPGELRIATLVAMANLLGIPLHTMFNRPPAADPTDVEGNNAEVEVEVATVTADAEQLVATLYDTGRATPTLVSDLANAYGWTTDRVYAAATEATRRLTPAGLRAHTSHGELFIAPINDHHHAQQALAARRTYERGLSYIHYKAAHQVLTRQQITVTNSGRQRLRTLGGLVNTGILEQINDPAFTAAAEEAFL